MLDAIPPLVHALDADAAAFSAYWRRLDEALGRLPAKRQRSAAQAEEARAIREAGRASRARFLQVHTRAVYDALTEGRTKFLRVEALCRAAATAFPGLVPADEALARESALTLPEKEGREAEQGLFLSYVLADPLAGAHLCHAMLLAREDSRARLRELEAHGALDFGGARLERRGRVSIVTMTNPRFLNAEDETTLPGFESAVDLALMDPRTELCVLRGGPVEHPKYAGRRLFGAGINLTHLYEGRIGFLWYLVRDLGVVNKLYRGLATPDAPPEEDSIEKPWIAAVEGFAIGGHCQLLLAVDHVLAAEDAYLTLPARREGIIPGAANLRLARHVGARLARAAILAERRIECASAEGRLLCDRVVPAADIDAEIERAVARLAASGLASAASNRRALRAAEEPLDLFRRYMAVYAREQAHCHFSPALVANLERNWVAARHAA
jgi:thioesterase DpgC